MLEILEPFIGRWEATDGSSRQELSWGLERRLVRSTMWFRDGDGWKVVSEGAYYRDPGRDAVVGFAETIDMPVEHFDIETRVAEDGLDFSNRAYAPDGSAVDSTEEWRMSDPDRYAWQLYRSVDGHKEPWLGGEWQRIEGQG